MKITIAALVLPFCISFATPVQASAQIMEMNGTWVLNTEKTIGPSPGKESLVFDISEGVQTYTMTSTGADGREGLNEWAIEYDGLDHPTNTGSGNTASIRQLGEKTELVINKTNGQVTSTYTRVLVDDDRTIMSIGRDGDGNILWVRVFEKQ
jgi:hypothetical protein